VSENARASRRLSTLPLPKAGQSAYPYAKFYHNYRFSQSEFLEKYPKKG